MMNKSDIINNDIIINNNKKRYSYTAPIKLINNNNKKKIIMENSKPTIVKSMLDREGLDKAYNSESKIYSSGNILFVAGTNNIGDVYDDLRIPLGDIKNSKRYIDTQAFINKNPQISKLVSHSLGSSVSMEIKKNNPQIKDVNYYGSPFISVGYTNNNTYKNPYDIFSMFDKTAKLPGKNDNVAGFSPLDQHSYKNFNNSINNNIDYKTYVNRTNQ